jgi:hypothetical protein
LAPIAFERIAAVKVDDRTLLFFAKPVVPRDVAIVLVCLAIPGLPVEELPAGNAKPGDESLG